MYFPSVVENVINKGTPYPTRAGTKGFYDSANNIRVVINSEKGRVVSIIPGKPPKGAK